MLMGANWVVAEVLRPWELASVGACASVTVAEAMVKYTKMDVVNGGMRRGKHLKL
jgi:hypothetical protein